MMKEVNQEEYNYVVNLFFTESPYTRETKDKKEIMKNFIVEFITSKSHLLEINKIYSPFEIINILKNFYDGESYKIEKNGNIRIKTWIDWRKYSLLKAELIFLDYISRKYNFTIFKSHKEILFM
nr:hypothetical protein [uncultured Fusobacterium sp.]